MHSGATDKVTDSTTSVTIKHSALPVPGFQIENESIVLEGHSPHSRAEPTIYDVRSESKTILQVETITIANVLEIQPPKQETNQLLIQSASKLLQAVD